MGWGVNLRDAPLHVSIRAFPGRSNWGPAALERFQAGSSWTQACAWLPELCPESFCQSLFWCQSCGRAAALRKFQASRGRVGPLRHPALGTERLLNSMQMQMRWLLLGYLATCLQANIKSPFIRHTSMASISLHSTVKYRCREIFFGRQCMHRVFFFFSINLYRYYQQGCFS